MSICKVKDGLVHTDRKDLFLDDNGAGNQYWSIWETDEDGRTSSSILINEVGDYPTINGGTFYSKEYLGKGYTHVIEFTLPEEYMT